MALHQGIYTLCKGDQNEITEYLGALSVFDNSSVLMLFRRLLASIYSTAFQHLTHELLWTARGFLFIYLDKGRIQSVCSSSKCQRCKGSTPTTSGAYLLTGACVPSQRSNPGCQEASQEGIRSARSMGRTSEGAEHHPAVSPVTTLV